ncbi:2-dehydropantoate 2-reductase [Sporosarcina sp. A2]|uniref:2-dehydropantoate 2-reductase n=1 Tax=Sporosarcina sp. A2 TaxID=3393449 RepID=UPI003D7BAA46
MQIVIAGAGAMGLLVGSYFAQTGQSIAFYTRREEQAAQLREKGLNRIVDGRSTVFQVDAFSRLSLAPCNALWIIAVKSRDLTSIIEQLEAHAEPRHLLFIQNGLRHLEVGRETSVPSVAIGSLTHGALKEDDRTIIHKGFGVMNLAELKGSPELSNELLKLQSLQFPIHRHSDAFQMLMEKAIINCCINPITTILEMKNGEILENSYAHDVMRSVYEEIAMVYPQVAKAVSFSQVEEVCKKTAENQSSMFNDRRNKVPMEIDTIIHAILEGHEEEMPVLYLMEKLLNAIDGRVDRA